MILCGWPLTLPHSSVTCPAGEFEPHVGCWMGWPESDDSAYLWREGGEPARQAYANVARAISQFEPLFMVANPGEAAANAREAFKNDGNVNVVEIPINDGWTRDWGPSVSASPSCCQARCMCPHHSKMYVLLKLRALH